MHELRLQATASTLLHCPPRLYLQDTNFIFMWTTEHYTQGASRAGVLHSCPGHTPKKLALSDVVPEMLVTVSSFPVFDQKAQCCPVPVVRMEPSSRSAPGCSSIGYSFRERR